MKELSSRDGVLTSVQKAFSILEFLAANGGSCSLAEISERCRVSKPSAVRLLRTLLDLGYADRPGGSREYCLGPKLPLLTANRDEHTRLKFVIRPLLEKLHEEFNETVNLGVLLGHNVMYLDFVETTQALRMIVLPGTSEEWQRTALGRAVVSALSDSERDSLLRNLQLRNDLKSTDLDLLRSNLEMYAKRGYAEEEGESSEGAGCIAVPLFQAGYPRAAVSVAVPLHRLSAARKLEIADKLKKALAAMTSASGDKTS